ncbi:hypothetical protein G5V59_25240 [Nocardioides sp. W3-2-3]|nr:M4 family metallopeptidase [Nocardioides convexus]NHA01844.1 hypothetical protein [Nocardioides convexus]
MSAPSATCTSTRAPAPSSSRRSLLSYATGTGTGHHNGPNPLPIETTQVSSTSYNLTDSTIPGLNCGVENNSTATVPALSGTDNAWGDGTGTSKETGCVDALFGLQTQDKMLAQWLGRDGFKGNGGGWQVRVGLDDTNAFYCSPGLVEPGYCTGTEWVRIGHNQANTKWVTNLDVVAHEYGHGIDQNTPGGISGNGTQEFVGDVFGALTEAYANEAAAYDPPDYLVGEEVNLVGSGEIRNMYNPSAKGDPNCYSRLDPERGGARSGRTRQPLVLPARRGHQPRQRTDQHHVQQRRHADRHRHPEGRQDLLQRDADEDLVVEPTSSTAPGRSPPRRTSTRARAPSSTRSRPRGTPSPCPRRPLTRPAPRPATRSPSPPRATAPAPSARRPRCS